MATQIQIDFVKAVYTAALQLYDQKPNASINPLFVTAQAALESGWGKSAIGNNLFGITKGSWRGKTQLVLTSEYFSTPNKKFAAPEKVESITRQSATRYKYKVWRLFRDYDTLGDCLADHLRLLSKPMYADAWQYRNDPVEFARHISDNTGAKYATAPDYADTMRILIKQVELIVKNEILKKNE